MHRLILAGFGGVGREFARLLLERRRELARDFGLEAEVVAILTATHGRVERRGGIDLQQALRLATRGESLEPCGRPVRGHPVGFIKDNRLPTIG